MSSILAVVGARPNFMKIAPVLRAFRARDIPTRLVHTGQHYDAEMKASFFGQLGIPEPDVDLGVGSGSHAAQTGQIMMRFEPVVDEYAPDAVVVVGDVNSTVACALVAVKKHVPVFHIEAGLRSFDRTMPEEINRVLTDQMSEKLFTTERTALDNLTTEGVAPERVHFVGNVMIDSLLGHLESATEASVTLARHGAGEALTPAGPYGVLTLHRPSNVDDPEVLRALMDVIGRIASTTLPLVFPVHPRTRGKLDSLGMGASERGLIMLPPVGYLEMLGLMKGARVVLTDSGGMQEETTALGVPCLTLRENTERPITVSQGTNTIVGADPSKIEAGVHSIMETGGKAGRQPERWDGKASERIAAIVSDWMASTARELNPSLVENSGV